MKAFLIISLFAPTLFAATDFSKMTLPQFEQYLITSIHRDTRKIDSPAFHQKFRELAASSKYDGALSDFVLRLPEARRLETGFALKIAEALEARKDEVIIHALLRRLFFTELMSYMRIKEKTSDGLWRNSLDRIFQMIVTSRANSTESPDHLGPEYIWGKTHRSAGAMARWICQRGLADLELNLHVLK